MGRVQDGNGAERSTSFRSGVCGSGTDRFTTVDGIADEVGEFGESS
jgi:hypothetical protein